MKVRVMSDLHLEFMPETWALFVQSIVPEPGEHVLVLAGDIAVSEISAVLEMFCERWPYVVYVLGNHEFYGSTPQATHARAKDSRLDLPNLLWLENEAAAVDGVRFLGASLWFPRHEAVVELGAPDPRTGMMDFYAISSLEPWVYEQNADTLDWLVGNVRPGDVVVTHHLPTHRSVHPKYTGSPLNRFFLGDQRLRLDYLMHQVSPAAWIHGHTHDSFDYMVGKTRVVCNPRGYYPRALNPDFDPGKSIDVG